MTTLGGHYRKSNFEAAVLQNALGVSEEGRQFLLKEVHKEALNGKGERIFKRMPVFAVVDYIVRGRLYQDFLRNVSFGGVFIETPERFSVGQEVLLTFSLPNLRKAIKTAGRIIRTSPKGFAAEFKEGKETNKSKSKQRLIEKRKRKRVKVKEAVFAVVNKPCPQLGEITDISGGGLAFSYSANVRELNVSSELDILLVDPGLRISGLPVKTVWDFKIFKDMRKQGVQFQPLTYRQRFKLKWVIQEYTL